MNKGIIYKITNKINGKIYIGQTIQKFEKRIKDYKGDQQRYNYGVHAAIKKYGFSSFKFEILYKPKINRLDAYERYLIKKLNANNRDIGYNIEQGGQINKVISESSKEKRRQTIANRKFIPKKRRVFSEEHKKAMRKPKNLTTLQREKAAQRTKLQYTGIALTEEHKNKIAKSHRKRIIQLSKEGIFIKNWDSITEASNTLKINISSISECLNFKQHTAGNFKWKHGTYTK